MRIRQFSNLCFAAFAVLIMSGAAVQAETIRVLNWSNYIDPGVVKMFQTVSNIKVDLITYDSDDEIAEILNSDQAFDVIIAPGRVLLKHISDGRFERLDNELLPNRINMSREYRRVLSRRNPNKDFPPRLYLEIYLWGTTGMAVDRAKLPAALADDIDSLALYFDPAKIKQMAHCGVHVLDAPEEVIPAVLNYLGEQPNTTDPQIIAKAEDTLMAIRPYIKSISSTGMEDKLADGRLCASFSWAGESMRAKQRAIDLRNGIDIHYSIPIEGARVWMDLMTIDSRAPNREGAYKFYNYLMRPDVAASISNHMQYANGNAAANMLISDALLDAKVIYPARSTMKRLYFVPRYEGETKEVADRIWAKFKAGG
ncbi:MAG: extracellular solute-binding protein [Alphaproteobacteria bacterium]|nr:MAG: extracellular solute-binding protein [Alphaproteobacteria bacterium]